MLYFHRHRPSNFYLLLFPILLFTCLFITFYDEKVFTQRISLRRPSPVEYLHVRLDFKSNTAKCHVHDNVIIYILSLVTNFQRRKVIRSTWASPISGTCFVFIVGKIPQYDSIKSLINNEQRQYQDIIQVDHMESYANVVYKELGALHWSSHFYPFIPYLFKTDDDLILDSIIISDIAKMLVTNLVNETSYISTHRPALTEKLLRSDRRTLFQGGWAMDSQPTLRSSKFAISEDVWPHSVLPPYCSGFGWLMSKHIRDQLVQASNTYPLKKTAWIGDVFISGFLARAAGVKCSGISIDYEQTPSANCSCLMTQIPMLTVCSSTFHGGIAGDQASKYREYEKAWKVIEQRHRFIKNIIDC